MAYAINIITARGITTVTLKAGATVSPGDLLGYSSGWVKADSDAGIPALLMAMSPGNGDATDGSAVIRACTDGVIEDLDAPYTGGNTAQYLSNTAGLITESVTTQKIGFSPSTSQVCFELSSLSQAFSAAVANDVLLNIGTTGGVIVNRSTILNANTALTGAIVGTPVTPAVAANSVIISTITADGDILLATQTGGNSHAVLWNDSSAGITRLYGGAGLEFFKSDGTTVTLTANTTAMVTATATTLALGGAAVVGSALTLVSPTTGTVVTAVGTRLHQPAVSLTDAGSTGTIAALVGNQTLAMTVLATNTITYTDVAAVKHAVPVASTGATFTRKYSTWDTGDIRSDSNLVIGVGAFGSTPPVGALVLKQAGTPPVGAATTTSMIYASATVPRKILADGTDSAVG